MKDNKTNPQERGQSLVELAISMTVLLILLAGLVDLGRAFFTYITLRDAAQEGASYASVIETSPLIDSAAVIDYCTGITKRAIRTTSDASYPAPVSNGPIDLVGIAGAGEVTVQALIGGADCTSVAPSDICKGKTINVKVTYGSFPMTMPFMGTFIGSQTITLSAEVDDMILTPACQ